MKKIVSIALALLLLLTVALLPLSVSAEGESDASDASEVITATKSTKVLNPNKLNISIGSGTAKQGDLVEIPVVFETNPGIWGVNLDVHYDENVMVLQTAVFSDEFKKDMSCIELNNLSSNPDEKNYYIPFGLNATGNSLTQNVTTTGLFATLTFLVIPGCQLGDTNISITYKPANVINVDGNEVLTSIPYDEPGVVTVTKGKDAEPGVTYFPERTRKSTTAAAKTGLSDTTLILILVGVVVVVGAVLAVLVIRKPEGEADDKAAPKKKAVADDDVAAPKAKEADKDIESKEDEIDDQA